MIRGMVSSGVAKPEQIMASDCFAPCRAALESEGIGATADNDVVVVRPIFPTNVDLRTPSELT